jgi:hypothetical protein
MLRNARPLASKSFSNLSSLFYSSFFFSMIANSVSTLLTVAFVLLGVGRELNPLMILELRVLGLWVVPLHIISILAYYVLFYLTIRRTVMTDGRFKLWCAVLVLIPVLSSFDLIFDLKSAV